MLEQNEKEKKERKPDWCIVRWHNGDLLVFREYQWWPQGKYFVEKWKYVAKGLTEKQANDYSKLFKE